jgi:hypothetical protein
LRTRMVLMATGTELLLEYSGNLHTQKQGGLD